MELYAGLDLHSRNSHIGIMDNAFNRVLNKRVPNHLELILQTLDPFNGCLVADQLRTCTKTLESTGADNGHKKQKKVMA